MAQDFFSKTNGIDGESQDASHLNGQNASGWRLKVSQQSPVLSSSGIPAATATPYIKNNSAN